MIPIGRASHNLPCSVIILLSLPSVVLFHSPCSSIASPTSCRRATHFLSRATCPQRHGPNGSVRNTTLFTRFSLVSALACNQSSRDFRCGPGQRSQTEIRSGSCGAFRRSLSNPYWFICRQVPASSVPAEDMKPIPFLLNRNPASRDSVPTRIQSILDHRGSSPSFECLVRWYKHSADHDSWVASSDFEDAAEIQEYGRLRNEPQYSSLLSCSQSSTKGVVFLYLLLPSLISLLFISLVFSS